MTLKQLFLVSASAVCMLTISCSDGGEYVGHITRLDQELAAFGGLSFDHQLQLADSLAPEIDAMFRVLGVDHVTVESLALWSRSPAVQVFQPAVDSVFPNVNVLEADLGQMLHKAQLDSLKLPHMRFASVTWGNPRKIVRVDSVMLIALNHYLGADYPGYEQWQQYRRMEKTPAQLPYDLAAALAATQYPMDTGHGPTLLSWMLYEGALVEARMRLVPKADAAMALGYTPEQYKYVEANCKRLWDEMALRKLIYTTDPSEIDRYLASAPNTPLLQSSAPGRVGRYIGYRIVRSYLKRHPHASLAFLLSSAFYGSQQSLIDSGFNGR